MFKIGDFVLWYSKTRRKNLTGQIVNLLSEHAYVIHTTWDGVGHHWYVKYGRLRKINL